MQQEKILHTSVGPQQKLGNHPGLGTDLCRGENTSSHPRGKIKSTGAQQNKHAVSQTPESKRKVKIVSNIVGYYSDTKSIKEPVSS